MGALIYWFGVSSVFTVIGVIWFVIFVVHTIKCILKWGDEE